MRRRRGFVELKRVPFHDGTYLRISKRATCLLPDCPKFSSRACPRRPDSRNNSSHPRLGIIVVSIYLSFSRLCYCSHRYFIKYRTRYHVHTRYNHLPTPAVAKSKTCFRCHKFSFFLHCTHSILTQVVFSTTYCELMR